MKTNTISLKTELIALLIGCIIVWFSFNIISFFCQLNFYNTYIDKGLPNNLHGDHFFQRWLLMEPMGYSIRFSSPTDPLFLGNSVRYSSIPKTANKIANHYSLAPDPWDILPYLKSTYPSDLASLNDIDNLFYFHTGSDAGLNLVEHRYIIRNNKTNVNFLLLKRYYTGT